MTGINAAAVLLGNHDAESVALVCEGQSVRHGALRQRVACAAALWRSRGIQNGDRIAIQLCDGIDWVIAFLGTIWVGAVAVPVNPHIPAAQWQNILAQSDFAAILCDTSDQTPPPWQARVLTLALWRHVLAACEPMQPTLVDENTPAFWCHSSGTSGPPKAVVHAHRFALSIERISRERLGIERDDRLFASSRLFFSYPQTNSLFAGLKIGATVVLDPGWPDAASVAAIMARARPSVLFCVPSLYRNLLQQGLARQLTRHGLRLCVSAGEPLPASLVNAWRDATGLCLVDGYGASEVQVLVLTAMDGDSSLQPSPGVQVQALDAQAAANGLPTRLCFQVATQALGYHDRPQAQAEFFHDDGFCPADLFVRSGDGWRFAGREDAMVKIAGRWVDLVALEDSLAEGVPGLMEAAAACVPDTDGVAALAYFYVAPASVGASVEQVLRERCLQLPPHQRPRWLRAIDALPRTATGKLLRRELVQCGAPLSALPAEP